MDNQSKGLTIPFSVLEAVARAGMQVTPVGETDTHYVLSVQGGAILPIPITSEGESLLALVHVMLLKNDVVCFAPSRILGPDGQPHLVPPAELFNAAVPAQEIIQVNKVHIGSALRAHLAQAADEVAASG